ncbi:uncharacterized protein LOC119093350 [Pollicipes pollicipes]|uniref:uncharacterized protein LOC119093350 n=1 Tax=Pollicipes pollicipes TaxID=41117 RepID=UPI001885A099|nr:uncharacterized protein LOC119093350 [Pollicipes pollicipes]
MAMEFQLDIAFLERPEDNLTTERTYPGDLLAGLAEAMKGNAPSVSSGYDAPSASPGYHAPNVSPGAPSVSSGYNAPNVSSGYGAPTP